MRCVTLRTLLGKLILALFLLGTWSASPAQDYPNKPIRIIVPYPPGGFNDTLARTLGQKLTEKWGQAVSVGNRPGGGTTIGTHIAGQSAPDRSTLLILSFCLAVHPAL